MFERIFDLFRKSTVAAAKQEQREALLDLLVLGMYVDRHIANAEGQFIHEHALGLEWDGVRSVERFVDGSIRRARDVVGSDNATSAYLEDIALRLGDAQTRADALATAESLFTSDGQLAEQERALLDAAGKEFKVQDDS